MSDNDFTSGDPWGLDDLDTDATEAAAPPAAEAVPDDLPVDLADLSTIEAQSSPTIGGPLEESLSGALSSEVAIDTDRELPPEPSSEDLAHPDGSTIEGDKDLDLGDLGGFVDFETFSDIPENAVADAAGDLVEGALGDLSALEINPDQTDAAGPTDTDDSPAPSRRRLNPLLAASGLFGRSPTVPPLAMNSDDDSSPIDSPDPAPDDTSAEDGLSEEPLTGSPQIDGDGLDGAFGDLAADPSIDIPGLGSYDTMFEELPVPVEEISSSFGELSAVDVPDITAIQFDEGAVDFGSIELNGTAATLDDPGPIDLAFEDVESIDAELAETLRTLGDQTADSITLDPPGLPANDADDFFPELMTSIEAPVDYVPVEIELAGLPDDDLDMTANPHAETHSTTEDGVDDLADGESDSASGDATSDISSNLAEPDFSTPSSPPSVYHELESLGDDDRSETPESPSSESPESIFGAVLGGAKDGPDDPFAAIFGSGEEAMANVAAAAAAIKTEQPVMFTAGDSPTVDDLPDFLVEDEPLAEISSSVTESPAESSDAAPYGDSAGDPDEASFVGPDGYTDPDTDQEVTEPAADAGDHETRSDNAEDSEYMAVLNRDDTDAEGVEVPASDAEALADPGFVEINDATSPIPPLPPMPATADSFDPDPFSSGHDPDLTKVDADDLESTGSRPPDDPAAAVEAMFPSDLPLDFSRQTDMESSPISTNPPPIVGTTTTGVSEKKPIPEDWGTRSDEAYEGWFRDDEGVETWRMIVTNLPTVSGYDIDEFLGLAVADSMVASHDVEVVAIGRRAAIDALTEDGVLRGAHAIVAVAHSIQPVGDQILVTVSGTAVTLKPVTAH